MHGQGRKGGSLGLRLTGRLWGLGLKGQELLMKREGGLDGRWWGSMRKLVFRVSRPRIGGGFFGGEGKTTGEMGGAGPEGLKGR